MSKLKPRFLCIALQFLPILFVSAASVAAEPAKLRGALSPVHHPEIDASAFYMFRSYEPGRDGFVTLIANYNPLQAPGGGPHFYPLDERARYDLHVDNDGDGVEDLTFRFNFENRSPFLEVPVANSPNGRVPVGISNVFPAGPGSPPAGGLAPPVNQRINWSRTYTLALLRGQLGTPGQGSSVTRSDNGGRRFSMPSDHLGASSIPDYQGHAEAFFYGIDIPGCGPGRVFVGQRQESYAFNRGKYFDLVGITDRTGNRNADPNPLADFNVTSLALEVPIDCLTEGGDGVIGGWTTAKLPRVRTFDTDPTFDDAETQRGNLVQVTRMGNPFVNEAQIGFPDKNRFRTGQPTGDLADFGVYFQFPTLPVALQIVTLLENSQNPALPLIQPPQTPRLDLPAFYLTGLPGLNQNGSSGEMLRLNTSTPPRRSFQQNNLGLLSGDEAGFPNGRRPGDDVIDITLRILQGRLCHPPFDSDFAFCNPADAISGLEPMTDQVWVAATEFQEAFPYLNTPLPGTADTCAR